VFFLTSVYAQPRDTGLICAVDMGSNTFKFIIAEIKNGKYLEITDIRQTAGVGDDLRASEQRTGKKRISDAKLREIQSMLSRFQDECEKRTGARKMHAIATAAFREAENRQTISEQLKQQNIDLKILTEEEESVYAYQAATAGAPGFAVIDLGSRTTEFVNRSGDAYRWVLMPTGYKTAWDDFYKSSSTFAAAAALHRKKLHELISKDHLDILRNQKELVAIEVGEAASYVLGIPQDQIEGKLLSREQLSEKLKEISEMNFPDAGKVLPRLVLLDFVLEQAGYQSVRCTDNELNVAIVYRLATKTD
jgi:exopolyphosphatase/pppGpp-phosphohydrolase